MDQNIKEKVLRALSYDSAKDYNDIDNSPNMRHLYLGGSGLMGRAFRNPDQNSRGDDWRLRKAGRVPTTSGGDDYVSAPLMSRDGWNKAVEENAMTLDETPYHMGEGQWSKEDLAKMARHPKPFYMEDRHDEVDFPTQLPAWKRIAR